MIKEDTHADTDVGVDLDLIARCEYEDCRSAEGDDVAVAAIVNWCGCRILLCRPCTAAEIRTHRSFPYAVIPGDYTCATCGAVRYGLAGELSRIVPI